MQWSQKTYNCWSLIYIIIMDSIHESIFYGYYLKNQQMFLIGIFYHAYAP